MNSKRTRRPVAGWLGGLAALTLAGGVAQAEVAVGTTLDASNIDQLKDQTFDGHKIGDLLVGQQEKMIREMGWRMKLVPHKPLPTAPGIEELTEKHKGQATLSAEGILENYTTGVPFPDLDWENDDQAGHKLALNILRVGWLGDAIDLAPMYFLVINGKEGKGLEREQGWRYKRYLMSGRLTEPYVEDKEIVKYEALINQFPQDTKGLGLLTVNYTDGRLPDVYVYVKAFRRVRRLASSVWADPVQSTDFLFDETFGLNLDPTWYDSFNIKAKTWGFGTAHGEAPPTNEDGSNLKEKYPMMILDEAPYWNFIDTFEPREVYHVVAKPKNDHLVSYRDMFVETNKYNPYMYWQDMYDRKGEHWRVLYVGYSEFGDKYWGNVESGEMAPGVSGVAIIDVQRLHATVFFTSSGFNINPKGAQAVDYTPEAMPRMLD